MRVRYFIVAALFLFFSCTHKRNSRETDQSYSGSESCIQCHEKFYKLWEPSFHGKAMQHVNANFIKEYNLPESKLMELEGKSYQVVYKDSSMVMHEKLNNELINTYDIVWSLGGHNVFTFLAPIDKGKLQTIPLAYDINRKTWFNYPQSAVRHFADNEDQALPWKDRMYSFNTGCYNCHVSQLNSNYDLSTDTYKTTWHEAGINCETCHGPCAGHIRVCMEAKEGSVPEDLKIIQTSVFTPEQHDASCAPCHAKCSPITSEYMPGEPFFDHFNLATLEDPDFYPDGRDLGENYTHTGWLMNPCKEGSNLNCVTCHTSSGRNRFKKNPNNACTSCHTDKAKDIEGHTMHKADSEGAICVNCHVPSREFVGRFIRSDHSFRPPMPEATIKFGSPNACNQCHDDKTAQWANEIVKSKKNSNYQDETIYWAQLIEEARKDNWSRLDEMLKIINENKFNEVITASFIRLVNNCQDQKKVKTIIAALNNKSALVRAAAATSLNNIFSNEIKNALIKATNDKSRLVRISAAASLAGFNTQLSSEEKQIIETATNEYMKSIVARPDDWSSHYNLGIYHQNQGNTTKALDAYENAARLYPKSLMPLINSSVLYSYIGNTAKAEENLKKAVKIAPDNEAANLNLGLIFAEQGKMEQAKTALEAALKANPKQAIAAYNLSVIVAQEKNINDAIKYAGIAAKAIPEEPKYAYTLAFYQWENNQKKDAENTLINILKQNPDHMNAVSLLSNIYLKDGKKNQAIKLYEKTLRSKNLSQNEINAIQQAIKSIKNS